MATCRGDLYVEAPGDMTWGWYSPQQIPSLIAWLEGGSQEEQQLAEDIYDLYQPVLRIAQEPNQVCDFYAQCEQWNTLCQPVLHAALQHVHPCAHWGEAHLQDRHRVQGAKHLEVASGT